MTSSEPQWAKIELLGHVTLAGRLSEEERFGGKVGRVDIPQGEGFVTQWFGASAVYRVTLVSEKVARHVARQSNYAPVSAWDFPKQVPALVGPVGEAEEGEEDDDEREQRWDGGYDSGRD